MEKTKIEIDAVYDSYNKKVVYRVFNGFYGFRWCDNLNEIKSYLLEYYNDSIDISLDIKIEGSFSKDIESLRGITNLKEITL